MAREGRGGEGQGRRSHRVRTDVVLIALRREMPKGLGGCPLGHRVTAFTNDKNSNTHRHQSGHSHSALDSGPPLLGTERGTGSGRMRYLCRPEGRLADTSFNWTSLRM